MRLLKPSAYASLFNKNAKRLAKQREKRIREQVERIAWELLRRAVYARARGRCQVTGLTLKLHSDNQLEVGHAHHILYLSAGGMDDLANLILVAPAVHEAEHNHVISIDGTASEFTVTILDGYPKGYQPVVDAIRLFSAQVSVQ